ncbi:MAG: protein kinase [Planctomycetaceae bacterium]
MTSDRVEPSPAAELDRLIADCMLCVDRGEIIDVERLVAAHPRHAAELRGYFDSLAIFDELAGTSREERDDDDGFAQAAASEVGTSSRSPAGTPAGAAENAHLSSPSDSARSGSTVTEPLASRPRTGPVEFGRYRLLNLLGQGAMGTVYLAHDTRLDRRVAIKFPKLESGDPAEFLARFEREARAAARVQHPNICPIHDVGEIDGVWYISMAYVEGRTLAEWIRSPAPPSQRTAAALARKLALALAEAHERGIVHRDLKPSNVLVDRRGEPFIADFGLARAPLRADDSRLTHSGLMIGTPSYMAPEQVDAAWGEIGPATDIYALGAVLYEMLSGRPPFQGSAASVVGQIVSRAPPAPSTVAPQVDARLEACCLKMLSKRPAERPPSMRDAAAELKRIAATIDDHPVTKRSSTRSRFASRMTLWGGAALLLAALGVAIPPLLRSDEADAIRANAALAVRDDAPPRPQAEEPNSEEPAALEQPPAQPDPLPVGTLFAERFDAANLADRFVVFANPNFHEWPIADGSLRVDRLLPGGPRGAPGEFRIRSKQSFELDERGLRYSARVRRPEGTVPGGSSVGLTFGDYCVDFHPGHPRPGESGDYGSVALRKKRDGEWQPLFEGAAMPFIPALDEWHAVTVRVTNPAENRLLIRIRIEGPDADGNRHAFERPFIDDEPALADGRIGVVVFGRNPPGTNAAWFDDLEVARPAD